MHVAFIGNSEKNNMILFQSEIETPKEAFIE